MSAVLHRHDSSIEATRGQRLIARIFARKNELEDALADCRPHEVLRRIALETALATVYALMTGDLVRPSAVVAHALSRWLERNKHLA